MTHDGGITALLTLCLLGLAATVLRSYVVREPRYPPPIRGEDEPEPLPSEYRAGMDKFAMNAWAIYRTTDYDRVAGSPRGDAEPLPPRVLTPTESLLARRVVRYKAILAASADGAE